MSLNYNRRRDQDGRSAEVVELTEIPHVWELSVGCGMR